MRFTRYETVIYRDTEKKRKAYAVRNARELNRYALFADEIANEQTFVDIEMYNRRRSWEKQTAEQRARRALKWREARAKLAQYRYSTRRELRAYWQRCGWPGDPSYLLSMMHMYDRGRLELRPRPFRQTQAQREAVNALFASWAAKRAASGATPSTTV